MVSPTPSDVRSKKRKGTSPDEQEQEQERVSESVRAARSIIKHSIASCYMIHLLDKAQVDAIIGEELTERELPAIKQREAELAWLKLDHDSEIAALKDKIEKLERDHRSEQDAINKQFEKDKRDHQSEIDTIQAQLSAAKDTIRESAKSYGDLRAQLSWSNSLDRYKGAAVGIVGLARVDASREFKVEAWRQFRPYARSYVGRQRKSAPASRSLLSAPQPTDIMNRLRLVREDFMGDVGPPPGLIGGSDTDTTGANALLSLDLTVLDSIVTDTNVPYPDELLRLLLRRIQYTQPPPPSESLFPTSARRLLDYPGGLSSCLVVTPDDFTKSHVIGIVELGSIVQVYSWHPLEQLVVVYTWDALAEATGPDPISSIRAALAERFGTTFPQTTAQIVFRTIFTSGHHGHIGSLTVKLVEALLNDDLNIDAGLFKSSSALFSARTPSTAELTRLRLGQIDELTWEFAQSRLLWDKLEKGEA